MKKLWEEFKKFINRGNVVDMAVGVAVASAFTAIVTAFTKGFISPIIAMITGKSSLADLKVVLREAVLDAEGAVVEPEVALLWGAFVQAILDFLIIAIVFFLVIKIVASARKRMQKMQKDVRNYFTDADEKEAAAKAAEKEKAEAEKAAAEEAARLAAEAEAEAKAEKQREIARQEREETLLREIRDLLKNQK